MNILNSKSDKERDITKCLLY